MHNKIIVDSCLDYNEKMTWLKGIKRVPFKLIVDTEEIIDTDLDTDELLYKMKESNSIKSACPSPNDFMKYFSDDKNIFIVTISSSLSGSYNSAILAKKMYVEDYPNAKIHVFDSKSAASAEANVAYKVYSLLNEGKTFDEVVRITENYIKELQTIFIVGCLDNLAKNGRISKVKAKLASILHIVPILYGNRKGEIELKEQIRGTKRAFAKLVDLIGETKSDLSKKVCMITHVNAFDKANKLKEEIFKKYNFKDIVILKAGGLSTLYADNKGIVVTY